METIHITPDQIPGTIVKAAVGLGLPPVGRSLEASQLSPTEIQSILVEAGRDLANLHSKDGQGFGWLTYNPAISGDLSRGLVDTALVRVKGFHAPYQSWYDFLTQTFDYHTRSMAQVRSKEEVTSARVTELSRENREQMEDVWQKRPGVRKLLDDREQLLREVKPNLLQGNLHLGNIFANRGRYSGMADYISLHLGDPADDLAYFSVMPKGQELTPFLWQGWEEARGHQDIDEKFHLYRLWESYRKIYTRYKNHHYLGAIPEPIQFAQDELAYFGIQ